MGIIFQTCFPTKMSTPPTQPQLKVTSPNTLAPNKPTVIAEGMQRVGKHGKSHHEYLKIMSQHEQQQQFRPISLQQLSKHNTKQSAWLSLNGIVYDVTVYLEFHPGGDILLQGCGKECSSLFNQYHPWVNGKYLLQKYQVGFLN